MSEGSSALAPTDIRVSSPVKRRHPLERALVWGMIAVLAALACAETWSRYSYQRAYDFLGNRLEVGDEKTSEALDAGNVKDYLHDRKPSRTEDFASTGKMMSNGATHLEVYSWFTLNPVHRREMFVYYDTYGPAHKELPQVLSIQAVEEELLPWLSTQELKAIDRRAQSMTERGVDMSSDIPDLPGMPGMGARGRRRGQVPDADRQDADKTEPLVQQPAVDADNGDNPIPERCGPERLAL